MSAICIIDTSVFCELLRVPYMDADHASITSDLRVKIREKETLLLPMTAILETGNHIGQVADGKKRRQASERFVEQVTAALTGDTPFTPTPMFDDPRLRQLLAEFPDWATSKKGFGDLTIFKEWESACERHPKRRVYIWSKDKDLMGYDRKVS